MKEAAASMTTPFVEDFADTRGMLRLALSACGSRVVGASNGWEADEVPRDRTAITYCI